MLATQHASSIADRQADRQQAGRSEASAEQQVCNQAASLQGHHSPLRLQSQKQSVRTSLAVISIPAMWLREVLGAAHLGE